MERIRDKRSLRARITATDIDDYLRKQGRLGPRGEEINPKTGKPLRDGSYPRYPESK